MRSVRRGTVSCRAAWTAPSHACRPSGRLRWPTHSGPWPAHGFESWPDFADHVEAIAANAFEAAADAVVGGDGVTLASLLKADPELVCARSARRHHATLLHYAAANGVEDFRQKSPPNAVAIATALIDAGADVDALADTYGGGPAQTTLNLLVSSLHPANAGVQVALVELLVSRRWKPSTRTDEAIAG